MELTMRPYQDEDDYWQIREFLRETFLINDRRELSWQVYRFDYWRWHGIENLDHGRLEDDVFIWQTKDDQIVAVLNREGPGNVYLQLHPSHQYPDLQMEMITVAQDQLTIPNSSGRRELRIWCHEDDATRQEILTGLEYKKDDWSEHQRRRPMSLTVPSVSVVEGYEIRPLGDAEELPERARVSWKAFQPNEPLPEIEYDNWYQNIQRAPLYRRDLDIISVASTGEFASFCTIWFDDVARTGALEPVGTAPQHLRKGLGTAVIYEGLRRLKRLGATIAYVGSYQPVAHAFYASLGFRKYAVQEPWLKQI